MHSAKRERLCVSCEGSIPFDSDVCPFCATHQTQRGAQNSFQAPIFQNQSLEESLTSLYTPPYQGKRPQFNEQFQEEFAFAESLDDPQQEMPLYKEVSEKPRLDPLEGVVNSREEGGQKSSFLPTVLLLGGAHFATLGLMQLFFSKNGLLSLEWDASYWFFYFLASMPLFYYGTKKLKQLT